MKILLTGGTGSVGREAVSRLVRTGHAVRVIGRSRDVTIDGAQYASCDVTAFNELRKQVDGMDAIVHLAAIPNPFGGPTQEIFHVNCQGTYNVYAAAAEAGIKRVVCASSINALGFTFGIRGFTVRYFPIDEDHPSHTTDPYSFSKQVMEQTAAYFWRREGISGVCLRLPAVYDVNGWAEGWMMRQPHHFKAALDKLLALSVQERADRVKTLIEKDDAARLERFSQPQHKLRERWGHHKHDHPETEEEKAERRRRHKEWREKWRERMKTDPDFPFYPLMAGRTDFWAGVTAQDCALAIEKSLVASYEGSHPLFINDRCNILGVESELLAATLFPGVTERTRPLRGVESLVSIDRARKLIGFEPEHSMEDRIREALANPPPAEEW